MHWNKQNKINSSKKFSYSGERLNDSKLLAPQRIENLARFEFFIKHLPDGLVLDYGCGIGEGTHFIATHKGYRVFGLDISIEAVNYASKTFKKPDLSFTCGDVMAPIFASKIFDGIISLEVIEHITEAKIFLNNVNKLLKRTGVFMLSTPNRLISSPIPNTLWPDHVIEYDAKELRELLNMFFHSVTILGEYIPVYEDNTIRKFVHKVSPLLKLIVPKFIRIRALPVLFSLINPNIRLQDVKFTSSQIEKCPTLIALCKHPIESTSKDYRS
jgi:SAM-dependent methyltransferase